MTSRKKAEHHLEQIDRLFNNGGGVSLAEYHLTQIESLRGKPRQPDAIIIASILEDARAKVKAMKNKK
jgi:hypothetical protein